MQKLLLGLDIGSSSVKASLVVADSGQTIASAQSPKEEMGMVATQPGWAEQDPEVWWQHACLCIKSCIQQSGAKSAAIKSIGIAYQMHGLVAVDKLGKPVRPSIIWCDSRAVAYGEKAFLDLSEQYCLSHLLNSPANFTASKLKWVQEKEPSLYSRIDKIMLPGDYIAYRLTGEICTSESGLSEGIFWDFKEKGIAQSLLTYFGFASSLIPKVNSMFSITGEVTTQSATETGLSPGTPVSYRAGDQPNNAFSLNVLNPGETAATAGTSGVIYSVTNQNAFDPRSRVNAFIHVNNTPTEPRNGILLCVNGTGILNSWLRRTLSNGTLMSYQTMNDIAAQAPVGAEGLRMLPFGNGAERILENRMVQSSWHGLDFNRHGQAHIFRAAQEGIVFALNFGFEILKGMGVDSSVIRAGHANMFLSPLFRSAFVNTIGVNLELYETDGAKGAALGGGVGAGIYASFQEAFQGLTLLHQEEPNPQLREAYAGVYSNWKTILNTRL